MINKDLLTKNRTTGLSLLDASRLLKNSYLLIVGITFFVLCCGIFWLVTKGQIYENQALVEILDRKAVLNRGLPSDFLGTSMMDEKIVLYLREKKIDSMLVTNAAELIHFIKTDIPGEIRYRITVKGNNPIITNTVIDALSDYVVDGLIYSFYVDEAFFQEKLIFDALSRLNKKLIHDSTLQTHQHLDFLSLSHLIQGHLKSSSRLKSNFKLREDASTSNYMQNAQLIDQLLEGFGDRPVLAPADTDKKTVLLLIAYMDELGFFLNQTKSGRDVLERLIFAQQNIFDDKAVEGDLSTLAKLVKQRNAEFLKDFGSPSLFSIKKIDGASERSKPLSFVIFVCLVFGFFLSLMVLFCLSWRKRPQYFATALI